MRKFRLWDRIAAVVVVAVWAPCIAGAQTRETLRAVDLFRAKRIEDAKPVLLASANAGDPWAHYWLGRIDFNQKLDSAVIHFERAAEMSDTMAEFHVWLGRGYGAQAERASIIQAPILASKVRREWERAIAIDPKNLDAREELVAFHLRAPRIMGGDVNAARKYAAEARRLDLYRGGLLVGRIADHEKQWSTSEPEYRALIRAFPDSALPASRLGTALVLQQRWDDAFTVYDALLTRLPGNALGLFGVGKTAAFSGKRLNDGAQALRQYVTLTVFATPEAPGHAVAYYRLGAIDEKRGDFAEARKDYQAGLALEPNNRDIKDALAKLR